MIKESQLTIFISSPESYKDIFDIFYTQFKKCWRDCKYEIVLSTNYKAKYDGVRIISSGDPNDGWVSRTSKALKQIDSTYVLVLCDDLFISEKVNSELIESALEYMEKTSINYFRLKPLTFGKVIQGTPFYRISTHYPYGKNLQMGIFRKVYLQELVEDDSKTAWDIENEWLNECMTSKEKYLSDAIGTKKAVIKVIHGVQKTYWIPSALKEIKRKGIPVNNSRQVLSSSEEMELRVKEFFGNFFSPHMRKRLKIILKKCGIKFASDC